MGSRTTIGPRRGLTGLLLSFVLGLGVIAAGTAPEPARADASSRTKAGAQPNIVFFLTDDLSTQHLRHMPNVRRLLVREGASFERFFANVALCCPARTSILTGKYAHNTGILGNNFPDGFHGFRTGDEATSTYPLALQRAGYTTSLMGKYLNGYPYVAQSPVDPTYVPPGWSDWAVPVRGAFRGTNYDINVNGKVLHRSGPGNYLGDVLNERTLQLIRGNTDGSGLALFLSYYGPHNPMPTSPVEKRNARLRSAVEKLRVPRTPDFNERDVSDKPAYVRRQPRLTPEQVAHLDAQFRRQVLSARSIDRYVGTVVEELERTGQLDNTYLVFSSDHGYHMGSHRLALGKNSPYLTDVRVPLVVRGPGIEPGTKVRAVTGNIDLAPTFAEMAGVELAHRHDGESLLGLARGERPEAWRRHFFVQRGMTSAYADTADGLLEPAPELEQQTEERIPRYRAVVSSRWTYVEHKNGERELYDLRRDPHQLDNLMPTDSPWDTPGVHRTHRRMQHALRDLAGCVGVEACRVG